MIRVLQIISRACRFDGIPHKLKRRRRYAFVLGSVEWLSIHDLFPFSPLLAQKLFVNVLPLLDAVAFICTLEFIN